MAKLISPAVSTKQIDLSFVPQAISAIGAGIIGVAQKGPAFVPTTVNTYSQYRQIFGDTSEDNYMRYAAKQYLKNQGTLTVVRILGSTDNGIALDDGWSVLGSTAAALAGAELKAVIRKVDSSVTALARSAVNGSIRLTASYSGGSPSYYVDVTLNPDDSNFIGKVFPTVRSRARTTGGSPVNVGATYGLYLDGIPKAVGFSAVSCSALTVTSQKAGNKFGAASSPIVVSQGFGPSGSASVYELFKVVSTGQGQGTNTDVKIQISNITFDDTVEYPNFLINVRKFDDTDTSPNVIESFSVNLDPTSDDYILKVVGDKYRKIITGDGSTPYTRIYGNYDNKSKYIRIAHPNSTEDNFVSDLPVVPSNARPQGFKGFAIAKSLINSSSTYAPSIEYVKSQKRRTNYTDLNATGGLSNSITLGYDFNRMDPSFLKTQMHLALSGSSFESYVTKGFYVKRLMNDASPLATDYDIRDLTVGGTTTISSTLIVGGSQNNVRFAFPLFNGSDGWNLNTNDTPQQQMMFNQQSTRVNNAIDLFANRDQIDVNMLGIPGLGSGNCGESINKLIDLCNSRGDCLSIIDLSKQSSARSATYADGRDTNITQALDQASGFDNSYASTFYPWIELKDSTQNKLVWVPGSVAAYAAIAYNDRVAHPWYAAAGFKRGVLDFATNARLRLTKDHRDSLYDESINPIATIKDQIIVFGNRTTQKKNTALRGLDIRRGMIDMKKLIVSVAQYVLFDKNTLRSRDQLVNKVTPILETMQSQQGLNAFRIVSNPTNDDINRNVTPVTIYVQFTPSIQYVPIDFVITPVGVQF